jgi:SpoVK/Ycf46/Vps4 family AAA+-type ATPase
VLLKLSDGFNGADLRNVVTEAGMFAIRDDRYQSLSSDEQNLPAHLYFLPRREYIQQEDLTKAARKVGEAKKHESKHARPPREFCTATSFLISCHHYSQTGCFSIAIDPFSTFHLIVSLHYL